VENVRLLSFSFSSDLQGQALISDHLLSTFLSLEYLAQVDLVYFCVCTATFARPTIVGPKGCEKTVYFRSSCSKTFSNSRHEH